ncbi:MULTISPECIES: hypothetical protein [Variovorax]|uniref:Uncharacterized protein n=1 Tax=Variovorax boronicumulans TaxID=436515 RepID=A0A1E7U3G4_9BURK|nr:hypothetical protein [Variovorax boronicumulans]ATA55906.1 hypothetical protein CKY39_23710 [Variovorax boronicumulans]MDP9912766.1 putative membrane protein YphA (DoxX/SURF4 family) [Variovorax boronicumulans]OEZ30638.1 hypothetical protein AO062_11735 [Variovorax boronicumulans]
MKTAGRLALGVLAWVTVVPLLGLLCMWLGPSVLDSPEASRVTMYAVQAINLGAAALLYWYAVPSVPHWGRRVAYFVAFVVLMVVASALVAFGVKLLFVALVLFWR